MDPVEKAKPRLHGTSAKLWEQLKPRARSFRKDATPAEDALWQRLRGRRLGVKFRRQHAVGQFIVDFVCLDKRLIVEVDGGVHIELQRRDQERDARLSGLGYRIVRLTNDDVLTRMEESIARIVQSLEE